MEKFKSQKLWVFIGLVALLHYELSAGLLNGDQYGGVLFVAIPTFFGARVLSKKFGEK